MRGIRRQDPVNHSIFPQDWRASQRWSGGRTDGGVYGSSRQPRRVYQSRMVSTLSHLEHRAYMNFLRWKLHLRPQEYGRLDIPALPRGKKAVHILQDFLGYLFNCIQQFFTETYVNGNDLWRSLAETVEYILPQPNGWSGAEYRVIRTACVSAGLVPSEQAARDRVLFVSEGEASLHFCLQDGLTFDESMERSIQRYSPINSLTPCRREPALRSSIWEEVPSISLRTLGIPHTHLKSSHLLRLFHRSVGSCIRVICFC